MIITSSVCLLMIHNWSILRNMVKVLIGGLLYVLSLNFIVLQLKVFFVRPEGEMENWKYLNRNQNLQ